MAAVLFSEEPYVSVLSPKYWTGKYCFRCFDGTKKTKICAGCHVAYYCTVHCQKTDWKKGQHKQECSILKRVANIEKSENDTRISEIGSVCLNESAIMMTLMVYKLAARVEQDGGENSEDELNGFTKTNAIYRKFQNLMGHKTSLPRSWWLLFEMYFEGTEMLKLVTEGQFMKYCSVIETNQIEIPVDVPENGEPRGTGLFLQASRFNHSCFPDVVKQQGADSRRSITWVLVNPRKANFDLNDLHISYLNDWKICTAERRSKLKPYQFTCQCFMCLDIVGDLIGQFSVNQTCAECDKVMVLLPETEKVRCICCNYISSQTIDQKHNEIIWLAIKVAKEEVEFNILTLEQLKIVNQLLHPVRNINLLLIREKSLQLTPDLHEAKRLFDEILVSYKFYNHPHGYVQAAEMCKKMSSAFAQNGLMIEAIKCEKMLNNYVLMAINEKDNNQNSE